MEKTAKEALFWELHHLGNEEAEEKYCSVDAVFSRNKVSARKITHEATTPRVAVIRRASPKIHPTPHDISGPLRSISFSTISSSVQSKQKELDSAEENACAITNRNMPKATGKRKRGQSFEAKPESQQVFKGSSFCALKNPCSMLYSRS